MISGFHFGIVSPSHFKFKATLCFLIFRFPGPSLSLFTYLLYHPPFFIWLQHVEGGICWVSSTSLSPPAWVKVTLLRHKAGKRKCRGIPPPVFIFRMFSFRATVVLILSFVCYEQTIQKTLEWSIVAVHLKTKQNTFIFHVMSSTRGVLERRVTALLLYPFPFSLQHGHLAACSSAEPFLWNDEDKLFLLGTKQVILPVTYIEKRQKYCSVLPCQQTLGRRKLLPEHLKNGF